MMKIFPLPDCGDTPCFKVRPDLFEKRQDNSFQSTSPALHVSDYFKILVFFVQSMKTCMDGLTCKFWALLDIVNHEVCLGIFDILPHRYTHLNNTSTSLHHKQSTSYVSKGLLLQFFVENFWKDGNLHQ